VYFSLIAGETKKEEENKTKHFSTAGEYQVKFKITALFCTYVLFRYFSSF